MPKIADIIKYEGDNNTFIWKQPLEDFNLLYFRQYADIAEAKIRQQTAVIDAETQV